MILLTRFEAKYVPEPMSGCWLWLAGVRNGYGRFRMGEERGFRSEGAHWASYLIHVGEIPAGLYVCHRCDTRLCVNPAHLFLGTAAENMQDAARKGRMAWTPGETRALPRGAEHHSAKLSADDVLAIRTSNETGVELARRHHVAPITVSRIRRRLIWRHI